MFERFTERARQVVVLAQDEARRLGHDSIGIEHLMLGLIREEKGLAARVLEGSGVTLDQARAVVVQRLGEGEQVATGQIPFKTAAKEALELSLREALSLDHNYIGTEHVLLGVLRAGDDAVPKILLELGTEPKAIERELIRMIGRPSPPQPEPSATRTTRSGAAFPPAILAGGLFVVAALAAGVFVGWLIWG